MRYRKLIDLHKWTDESFLRPVRGLPIFQYSLKYPLGLLNPTQFCLIYHYQSKNGIKYSPLNYVDPWFVNIFQWLKILISFISYIDFTNLSWIRWACHWLNFNPNFDNLHTLTFTCASITKSYENQTDIVITPIH